jgi:CheY-like chemotaxis protein
MRTPRTILVVDGDITALYGTLELLRDAGYECTGAATYDAAQQLLELRPYDLLITDVRLGVCSGLALVRLSREDYPGMGFIVLVSEPDPMVEVEARRYEAVCLVRPVDRARLLEVVASTMASLVHRRRWVRKLLPHGVVVIVNGRPANLLDASYGGLRLEMGDQDEALPPRLRVLVPAIGSSLSVHPVWTSRQTLTQTIYCGAEVVTERASTLRAWRELVDQLPPLVT